MFPSLGDAWEDLGAALSIDDETLQSINKKFPSLARKQRELFRAYLRSNPTPAWSDIIDALVKISKVDIARKVVDTFSLSSELLTTSMAQTSEKSSRPSSSLAVHRVEPDTAGLAPARVSKTDMHSSKSSSSGQPSSKPRRIKSDGGAEISTADTATVTPASKRVSRTEVLSSKKLDRPLFVDPGKPRPGQPRLVSDDGGRASPVEETDSHFSVAERDSMSSPPEGERELLSVQMHFSSDPMGDSNSSLSGGHSFRQEVRRSAKDTSPSSSDDFHSAEEAPLDEPDTSHEKATKNSYKSHEVESRSHAHVSHILIHFALNISIHSFTECI